MYKKKEEKEWKKYAKQHELIRYMVWRIAGNGLHNNIFNKRTLLNSSSPFILLLTFVLFLFKLIYVISINICLVLMCAAQFALISWWLLILYEWRKGEWVN